MAEKLDLTTPIPPSGGVNNYQVIMVNLNWGEHITLARVSVTLKDDSNGIKGYELARETAARDLMRALNKADLSGNSLHRRIFQKLIDDGHIAGTITGVPD